MTKYEYWQAHVAKNAKLANPEHEIRIKAGALHRLLDDAYEKGFNHDRLDSLLELLLCLYRYQPTIRL